MPIGAARATLTGITNLPISISMLASPSLGTSTVSSFATGSLSPTAGALILVGHVTRAGTTVRTHNAPTAAFSTTGVFVELLNLSYNESLEDGTSNTLVQSIWAAVATGSPGSGAVTCTTNSTTFQQVIAVAEVVNFLSSTPFSEIDGWAYVGTDVSATLTPSATSTYGVGFAIGGCNGTSGAPDLSTPFTDIASSPFTASALEVAVGTFTATPGSNTVEMTGGQSGRAKAVSAVFFNGAA